MPAETKVEDAAKQTGKIVTEGINYFKKAPREVIVQRRVSCYYCKYIVDSDPAPRNWACGQCGCFNHLKTELQSQECPVNRW